MRHGNMELTAEYSLRCCSSVRDSNTLAISALFVMLQRDAATAPRAPGSVPTRSEGIRSGV